MYRKPTQYCPLKAYFIITLSCTTKRPSENTGAHLQALIYNTLTCDIPKLTGLYRPLDGITNPKYKLLHLLTTNFFSPKEEGTSF